MYTTSEVTSGFTLGFLNIICHDETCNDGCHVTGD